MTHPLLKKILGSPSTLLALTTIMAYGLLLPFTGFYWDDWPFAWIANFLGPKEFFSAFAGIRPFLAPIFFVTTSLVPTDPIHWQIFAIIIRFVSGLSIWFMLSQVFPNFKRQVLIASLAFLVFPGYSQHWVAFTHINQEWIPFIFYILSFGYTASALRHPNKFTIHTISALLLLVIGVFPTEYFASLEPLRFLFIWVIITEKEPNLKGRFILTFKRWTPYLLVWLVNAAWLAYFFAIGSYGAYDLEVVKGPLSITQLLLLGMDAIWKAGFYAWGQLIMLASQSISAPSTLLDLGLLCLTFPFFIHYFSKLKENQAESKTFAIPVVWIGVAGILLGRLPSLVAGLPLRLQSSNDRFMISMMIGGSLFIVALTELAVKNPRVKNIIFAALISLGIGQQFFNANIFRRDWERQQEIFWQLAWRIPAMKPGTALLTHELFIDYETDVSFTAPINWMYAPDYTRSNVPYAILFTDIRLGGSLPALETGKEINVGLRTVDFQGSTSQAIVIYMPQNGCLRVLDPGRGDQITYDWQTHYLVDAIPLSDPSNIIVENDQTPRLPFLSEPTHTWCYYYTRAELAYQQKNWERVITLIDEAVLSGYAPEDPFEWLSYIEAKALTGDIEIAQEVSNTILGQSKNTRKGLCLLWQRVKDNTAASGETKSKIDNVLLGLQCVQ